MKVDDAKRDVELHIVALFKIKDNLRGIGWKVIHCYKARRKISLSRLGATEPQSM